MVLDVAGREHAGDAGLGRLAVGAAPRDDVAVDHLELALEQAGVGRMADRDEDAADVERRRGAGPRVLEPGADDTAVVAEDLVEFVNQRTSALPSATRSISLSCRIASARSLSRRWTSVTLRAMFDR